MSDEQDKKLGTIREQTDVIDEGQRTYQRQERIFASKFKSGDATPSIQDANAWACGTGVVVITKFRNGQNGQTIKLLGHANTTITHGTNIFTNTGANKVLAANKVYTFTMFNNLWYENA